MNKKLLKEKKSNSEERVKKIIINKFKSGLEKNKKIIDNINNKKENKEEFLDKEKLKIMEDYEKIITDKYLNEDTEKNSDDGEYFAKILFLSMKIKMAEKHLINDSKPLKVINNIYIGSIGASLDINNLKKEKITHIISLMDFPVKMYSKDFEYYNINIKDSYDEDISQYFEPVYEFIIKLLNINKKNKQIFDNKMKTYNNTLILLKSKQIINNLEQNYLNENFKLNENNILIHCYAGVSRSSSILISFIMKYKQMIYSKALEFVKIKRSKAQPNKSFEKQLINYEKKLNLIN